MGGELKVGIIGLDTSHSIEFPKRMQAPDCPQGEKVEGLKTVSCLRFPSAFQSEPDQDKRQKELEGWGVKVTRNLDEALEGVDAIMLEINNPSLHLEYFKKVMDRKKPIFLDKPPADNLKNAKEIVRLAKEKNVKVFSASSIRFAPQVIQLSGEVSSPKIVMSIGPLGDAPAGSSIIWYAVHAVEMLQSVGGRGIKKVFARKDSTGVVVTVDYSDGRRGIVQLNNADYSYGIFAKDKNGMKFLKVEHSYANILREIKKFFKGGATPVSLEDTLEVQAVLDAIEQSVQTGSEVLL